MPSPRWVDAVATDVLVVDWPDHHHRRELARATGNACLLLVEAGAHPPNDCGPIEDWIAADADQADVAHRRRTLSRRRAMTGRPRQDLARPVDLPGDASAAHRELIAHQGRPVEADRIRAIYVGAGGGASRGSFETMLEALRRVLAEHGQQLDLLDHDDLLLTVPPA